MPGDGRASLWVHLPSLEMSAAALAIVGDYVPFGIGQALGHRAGGNSLDNTLRVVRRHPTEWILADIRVHAVADGFGHGLVHLWAEDGTLLGTASQSAIVARRTASHGEEAPRRRALTHNAGASPSRSPACRCTRAQGVVRGDRGPRLHRHVVERGGRADAFTPLALAAAWAPSLRLGQADRARLHAWRRPLLAADRGEHGRGRARAAFARRHRHVVERDRRELERHPVRGARTSASATRCGSCASALAGEKVTEEYDTFHVKGFRLGVRIDEQPPILVGALRPGMLQPRRPRGRRRHHQLAVGATT